MRKLALYICGTLAFVAVAGVGTGLLADDNEPTAQDLVRVTVTVQGPEGKTAPTLTPADVMVYQNNDRRPVISWVPADKEAGLDLAILIDDSLGTSLSNQYPDLRNFIRDLPATTQVRVAYAANGTARLSQGFSSNHTAAVEALRLPLGQTAGGGSIYQSVDVLLKHWPEDGNRRAVLLISDGIDLNRGVIESEPMQNIDLQQAINLARRLNVIVYAMFANGSSGYSSTLFLLNNGQGSLLRLADETGGQAYFQGNQTPLSFAPFLDKLATALNHQYLLTFRAQLSAKGNYQPVRISTEVPGVKLIAPPRVYVPAAG
jgi:VWFA-related protein